MIDASEPVLRHGALWARFSDRDFEHVSKINLRKDAETWALANGVWTITRERNLYNDFVVVTEHTMNVCRQSGGPFHLLGRAWSANFAMNGRSVMTWVTSTDPAYSAYDTAEALEIRQWVANMGLWFRVDELAVVLFMWGKSWEGALKNGGREEGLAGA